MSGAPAATIRIAAAAIVNRRGQMLLVRKTGTEIFMQPGGKIDPGETARDALVRELREELGLETDEGALRFLGRFSAPAANEPGHAVEAVLYRLHHDGPVSAQAEIAELAWYPGDLPQRTRLAPLTRDHVIPAAGL
ncbi:MAG: NUDIX domain-containing protein [Nitratireductor sp.]